MRPSSDRRLLEHTARCLAKYTLAYGKGQLEFSLPDAVRPRTIVPGSRPVLADPLAETEARLKSPSARRRWWGSHSSHDGPPVPRRCPPRACCPQASDNLPRIPQQASLALACGHNNQTGAKEFR